MSDAADITVSVISAIATLSASSVAAGAALLATHRTKRIKRDTEATLHEVKNDHQVNLRVESDTRHNENSKKLDSIIQTQDTIIATQEEHGIAIAALKSSDEDHDDRIERIEHTWPRSQFAPQARHRRESQP